NRTGKPFTWPYLVLVCTAIAVCSPQPHSQIPEFAIKFSPPSLKWLFPPLRRRRWRRSDRRRRRGDCRTHRPPTSQTPRGEHLLQTGLQSRRRPSHRIQCAISASRHLREGEGHALFAVGHRNNHAGQTEQAEQCVVAGLAAFLRAARSERLELRPIEAADALIGCCVGSGPLILERPEVRDARHVRTN